MISSKEEKEFKSCWIQFPEHGSSPSKLLARRQLKILRIFVQLTSITIVQAVKSSDKNTVMHSIDITNNNDLMGFLSSTIQYVQANIQSKMTSGGK